jgi:glycosyltransferase involved in cell wall biosynthesis
VFPEPKSSAAGNRMMQLIDLFQSMNFLVYFGTTAQNIEYSENLTELGVKLVDIQLNASTFDQLLLKINPSVVLFDRFMIEEQYGWRVAQNCPNAIRILDTEDLHCLRHGRQNAIKENRSFIETDLISDVSKREIASILRCDITLMVSEFEIDLLVNYFKVPKEILFYMPIFADKKTGVPPFEERSDFVFIGNFLHDPNWDAVRYLSTDIWPKIHALVPNAKMLIYGSYPSQKVMELHKPNQNFHVLGRTADATEVIQNSRVMLAPLRFGAGIKGKLIESMQCGTPSITTSIGAEGMCKDLKWNGCIENDPNLFAASAVQLYQNQQVWTTCQLNGYSILEAIFKKAHYVHLFESYFNSVNTHLKAHRQANFMGLMLLHHTLSSTKYMSKWIEEKNKNNQ